MTKKCLGCGIELQNVDTNLDGYINDFNKDNCERCFRIKNYNEYKKTTRSNYNEILSLIDSNDLVLYISSLLNFKNIENIKKYNFNNVILVLTKKDLLPKSLKDTKIKNYFKYLNIKDIVVISSLKNYNIDELYNKINEYKTSTNVFLVGETNSGKSTLLNKLIKNYSHSDINVTSSPFPWTTLDKNIININDNLNIIDTPGLINNKSIINYIDYKNIKKFIPSEQIKPIIYQLTKKTSFIVGDLFRIDYDSNNKNSIIFNFNNFINIITISSVNSKFIDLPKKTFIIKEKSDIVINDMGFITLIGKCSITIYINDNIEIYERKSIM